MDGTQTAHIPKELDQAERNISEGEEHVARQRERIATDRGTSLSTDLLCSFEETLRSFKNHRDLLKRELDEERWHIERQRFTARRSKQPDK